MKYLCTRCGYGTINRFNFKKHLFRKNICLPKHSGDNINDIYDRYFDDDRTFLPTNYPLSGGFESKIPTNPPLPGQNGQILPTNYPQITHKSPTIGADIPSPQTKARRVKKTTRCEYCGLILSRSDHLKRHYGYCKVKHAGGDMIVLTKEEWSAEREIMKNEIVAQLIDQIPKTNNNINNNNQNNSNNTLIQINNYGKEDISYLKSDVLTDYCKTPMTAIQKIVRDIYFHEKHPENHTVRITNKQLHLAQVFRDGMWQYNEKNGVVDNLIDRGYAVLSNHFEEVAVKKLKDTQIARYRRFQDLFERDDPALRKRLVRDIEIDILNGTLKYHQS
jgi:hypothetical protein